MLARARQRLVGTGIRRNPEESVVNAGIPVPQEFLQKNPVKATKNQNSGDPLQNHVPVKNSSGKHRNKKKSSGILFLLYLSPQNKFLSNRNRQPSYLLSNFLVACICAWRHFLGVHLYSNYNIGPQNFERVLCLILLSHLVESLSSAILRCQSYLQECISRKGLLHNSEGSVLS